MSTQDLARLDAELNQMILSGQAMEAFEKFYAEDCHMQEGHAAPTVGKHANREREKAYFASIEAFHGAKINVTGVGDGVTFSEWETDVTMKGQPRTQGKQLAVRRWKDGKIVHEQFWHA